jgi:hypothetical protein
MAEQQTLRRASTAEHPEKAKVDIEKLSQGLTVTDDDEASEVFASLVDGEAGHDIKLRTMSWQKTAVLLFGKPRFGLNRVDGSPCLVVKCTVGAGEYVW